MTATNGKASFNINGKTIHSVLNLPVGPRGNNDLKGQSLLRLQDRLNDVKYILIDEYSMLGQTVLGWIDKRCRQATGLHDEILGGKSIILVGDPAVTTCCRQTFISYKAHKTYWRTRQHCIFNV